MSEEIVTYAGGLIALAVIIRYAPNVNMLLASSFGGVSSFAMTLLNPGAQPVMTGNVGVM